MTLRGAIVTALAASFAAACASSRPPSAPERAEQAEHDKIRAEDDARRAHVDEYEARQNALDAERARYEADQRARYAAAEAAQAERDAQQAQAVGVAEPQAGAATYPRIAFATSSSDLPDVERSTLDPIVSSLQAHPSRTVVIHAYADDTGDQANDTQLAQRRADAVAHYLESRGIAGDRITTRIVTREVAYAEVPDSERRAPFRRVVILEK